jgi:uncharacterized protein (TIGR03435 family)
MCVRRGFLPLLWCLGSAVGQPADPSPRFTAVTIKAATSDESALAQSFFGRASWWSGRCGDFGPKKSKSVPDSFAPKCTVTFANLLGHAYHLNAAQFTADRWMESTWFRIQAKAPPDVTEDRFRSMEQNLLADRFKLSAHLVRQEVVAYEMTVMKGGPKFLSAAKQPPSTGTRGLTVGLGINGTSVLLGDAVPMDQLASFISYFLDWPVVDATGLTGLYQIKLDLGAVVTGLSQGPPKIEAVRDQLGLILERTKTVTDVLVIDHVEKRPTPQ